MKVNLHRLGSLAWILLLGLGTAALQAGGAKDELHVLFIGNSFTYYHDLPEMVAELARAGKQRPLRYERETPGGCSLEKHWKDGKALAKIRSRPWDFVILQDHSQAAFQQRESMFEHGKKFDSEIKKHGARTILYMTWALQHKPDSQMVISKAYQELARELKAPIAPVGNAWQAALEADKQWIFHEKDQKHPNRTGTYVAACVFYATIYDKSPEGLPGQMAGLTEEPARSLQAIAWKSVQSAGR